MAKTVTGQNRNWPILSVAKTIIDRYRDWPILSVAETETGRSSDWPICKWPHQISSTQTHTNSIGATSCLCHWLNTTDCENSLQQPMQKLRGQMRKLRGQTQKLKGQMQKPRNLRPGTIISPLRSLHQILRQIQIVALHAKRQGTTILRLIVVMSQRQIRTTVPTMIMMAMYLKKTPTNHRVHCQKLIMSA